MTKEYDPPPTKFQQIQNQLKDLHDVMTTCQYAQIILKKVEAKVPKSPHGAGPDGWLSNVLRHLEMIVEETKRQREALLGEDKKL